MTCGGPTDLQFYKRNIIQRRAYAYEISYTKTSITSLLLYLILIIITLRSDNQMNLIKNERLEQQI